MTNPEVKQLFSFFHRLAEHMAAEGIDNYDLIAFMNRRATAEERKKHLKAAHARIEQLLAKHMMYAEYEATDPESPERIAVLGKLLAKLESQPAGMQAKADLAAAPQPTATKKKRRGRSKARLANAAVLQYFIDYPNSDPKAEDIEKWFGWKDEGITAKVIRKTKNWKKTRQRPATSANDVADVGDTDAALEELTGRQQRGRSRSTLRRQTR